MEPEAPAAAEAPPVPEARPAHLSVLDSGRPVSSPSLQALKAEHDRIPKKRLVSSAGPSVPVRKLSNDSVPSSWMARLEAARTTAQPSSPNAPAQEASTPSGPPPLRAQERKNEAPVGQPAHLLIAQLEADDEKRSQVEAERHAALFAEDRSGDIAKVEIALDEEKIKKKRIPDWMVLLALLIAVGGAAAFIVLRVRTEEGPKATIDPAVAAQAERKRQAVAALEEGHTMALQQKPDEAIKSYMHALELDPMVASAERGLAIAYAAKDDDTNAIEHYKAYLKLAPSAPDAADVREIVEKYEAKKAKAKEEAEAAAKAREEAEKKASKRGKKRQR